MDRETAAVINQLVALERDRELGFMREELHCDPIAVLQEALDLLDEHDKSPDNTVWDDDAERLGLDNYSE